jgi:hypothetical protein
MDKSKTFRKLLIKYKFRDSIERVYEILSDPKYHREFMAGFIDDLEFIKGSKFTDLNAELRFTWCKQLKLQMKVVEVVDRGSFRSIKVSTLGDSNLLDFDVIHNLYYDSTACTTLYVKETVIRQPDRQISKQEIENYRKENLEIADRMNKCLKMTTINLEQSESVIIEVGFEGLWENVTDWRLFAKLVPNLAEEVVYRGNPQDVGTLINIKTETLMCSLRVLKCEMQEYALEIFESKPESPSQELIFNFFPIDTKRTYLSFKHQFRESIEFKYLNNLIDNKKQMLVSLKKNLEKLLNN